MRTSNVMNITLRRLHRLSRPGALIGSGLDRWQPTNEPLTRRYKPIRFRKFITSLT